MKRQPLTQTERKILVYNKVQSGMSYNRACKELEAELSYLDKRNKFNRVEGKRKSAEKKKNFKSDFKLLKNEQGKKRKNSKR